MTLKDWQRKTGILPTHPTTERGAVSLICPIGEAGRSDLWHLEDFKVSTVSGPVIWLVPCNRTNEE
jgi:hypothetical protein